VNSKTVTIRLVTPAFLGGADQSSEWRTPPFKALLRQWWRVAYARQVNYDENELREAEGVLWGHAWLTRPQSGQKRSWALRSRISVALTAMPNPSDTSGKEKALKAGDPVLHPKVDAKPGMKAGPGGKGAMIGSLLYLGYGPLGPKGQTHPPALAAHPPQEACLTLSWRDGTDGDGEWLEKVLKLVHLFGCIGGRSRNGFGSIELIGDDGRALVGLDDATTVASEVSADLERSLKLDWPHAIGKDQDRLLLWKSRTEHETWAAAMKELAEVKIAWLTSMGYKPLPGGDAAPRHLANYPVTGKFHNVKKWDEHKPPFRLANQLRFKVHRVQGPQGKDRFVAIAFHLPHCLPDPLLKTLTKKEERQWIRENERDIWRKVHAVLDQKMARLA